MSRRCPTLIMNGHAVYFNVVGDGSKMVQLSFGSMSDRLQIFADDSNNIVIRNTRNTPFVTLLHDRLPQTAFD